MGTQEQQSIEELGAEVSTSVLTPLRFLERSARVWKDRPAVVSGKTTWTYEEHHDRVRRAAAAVREELEIGEGDRLAVLLPNVAAMLELTYAVPGVGGVLVPLNTRLAPPEYAYILEHCNAKVLVAYRALQKQLDPALEELGDDAPRVVWVEEGDAEDSEYEDLLADADPIDLERPDDERTLISINYTSGTTGKPKGVMTNHRGAYLHALGVIAEARLTPRSSYLWTLPMFHCNGWAYPWAVTAMGAKHVCLPKVEAKPIWNALTKEGVTHLCAAPTVLTTIVGAEEAEPLEEPAQVFVGGAPPSPALLEKGAKLNLQITHLYGLTETYGPLAVCAWNPDWDDLDDEEQAKLRARQGVGTVVSERLRVVDEDMEDVPADGETLGEVVMRGDNVMMGYLDDEESTREAFKGGWFHSGDLGVVHEDGYVELRDRLKDVIISGGENIATIEVEQALSAHDKVAEAAVVAAPHERWGEVPVAFVTVAGGDEPDPEELQEFARERLARFKVPKRIIFMDELPKTGTGKIQKYVLREQAQEDAEKG
jgi:acyl-CoA synthetase (AMP-forming)/AMP-acid ligase II